MSAADIGESGGADAEIILDEGQVYIWDPGALLDEYQADAIKIMDGQIWVLKETSRQWVRVDPTKPGKVRAIKGNSNGTD